MYIPGFSNMLMQPENMGGPARVSMDDILAQRGIQPSAPAIMQAPPAPSGALGQTALFDRETPLQPGAMASLPANVGSIFAPANNPTRLNLAGDAEGFTNAGLMAPDEDMAYIQQDPTGMAEERRVPIGPNETFRFTDRRTGETVMGTGPQEYEAVSRAFGRAASSDKANAILERQNPATGAFEEVARLKPSVSPATILAGMALLATGAGALATLPAAGAAAGAGAAGAGGSLAGSALGAGTMAAKGASMAGLLPGIVVTGPAAAAGGISAGALAGGLTAGAVGAQLAGFGPRGAYQGPPQQTPPEGSIEVTGTRPPATPSGSVLPPAAIPTTVGNNITVPGERPGQFDFPDELAALPPLAAIPTTAGGTQGGDRTLEDPERSLGDRLQEGLRGLGVSDYLRLSGLLLPLLDGGGGGGRRGLRTIPSGMFGGSSVFGGSLPRATLPGASTGFAPRAPSTLRPQTTQDYYRYGYGPAQSFFDYVPEGAANTSQAFTGYEQAQEEQGFYLGGMAGGGDMAGMARNSFAVNGPGTGRSDEIPAMLSDGEYVIDAETVALLGDGSSKAGADRLDKFRTNVRKDKGRNLARGDFSVNAKRPEHYLKGGRA